MRADYSLLKLSPSRLELSEIATQVWLQRLDLDHQAFGGNSVTWVVAVKRPQMTMAIPPNVAMPSRI